MRYEDASEMGSFTADQAEAQATLTARNDVDVILAGNYGPATGNTITGSGTISGSAGADMIAAGASITAIQGAGGTDTSFSGGKLQVAGEHGVLTIDAQGNYSYVRNQGSPNGVSDVFSYTLASRDGGSDVANLTINIGKTPTVVQANAVQVVPGPDGVVTLPEGVQLSDIHVVGRNLVIDMPDGTQMIIVDGAVFVPQLVLGTVEVPSTNLAALLIDSEPTPAAGPPQSSGGNFAVPVAPLDPGIPLGDLIPPTALSYTPPEVIDVDNAIEEDDDNLVLITDLTPSVSGGDATVDEDDLPAGSDTAKESLTVGGNFTISAPDGVNDLTIGSLNVIVDGVFQAGASMVTPLGNTLTITGYNAATGVISYTYTLGAAETHASGAGENSLFENFAVTLTDLDGDVDTDTLAVNIVDDVPTANNDVAGLLEGGASSVTVDVDTNDVPGADGTASRVFTSLTGTYGNLTLNPDGTQTYTLTPAGQLVIEALPPGVTRTDTFTYTLTDGDGDSDPATLVVTLTGADDPVSIFNLSPRAAGGEGIVDEDDLPDGSDTTKESTTITGDFNISAPDGIDDLVVGGINVIVNGVFQAGATGATPLGNTVTFTGYNAATGAISYSYTLLDNEAHEAGAGENILFEEFDATLTDLDGDTVTVTGAIRIIDDVPTANDDAFAILEGDSDNAITFDVDVNDVPGADGTASRNFTSLAGTYGDLTLNPDGTQTYTLNALGILTVNALPDGATRTDTFTYTLTDGDGDSDPATLTVTLTGTDDPVLITNLSPRAAGGEGIVDEDDLPDGSDTTKESTTITGDFNISAPDGVDDLVVGGINVIINGVFQVGATGATPLGNTVTFTAYNAATGDVSYSYTLLDNEAHDAGAGENILFEEFDVTLTDTDGDTVTVTGAIRIIDDVPTANDDAYAILEGDADNAITFDVDLNDVPGADGTASRNFTSLVGTYGNLTLNGDGTQTYTLNAVGMLAINALSNGATLNDNFTYTLTDGDGDSDPATLVITLTGTDDPVLITNLTPSVNGGEAVVDEDDLLDGSDTSKESLTVTGDFTISAPDGVNDLTVGGINVIVDGAFQVGATGLSPLGNQITFTGYNAATGVVSYSYTLLDNEAHANGLGENSLFDNMDVILSDTDNDVDTDTLSIRIVDDVPTANDDAFAILEGDADNAITFDVDLNDVPGADGTASRNFTSLTGTYGNLTLNPDGTQTYTLNATGVLAINALGVGATLNDNFTYTLTDGDGDSDPATLVITLTGTDDPVLITNLTPKASGGDVTVDEDDLGDGSDPAPKDSLTATGDFTISAPDGVNDLTVGGFNVIVDGAFQPGSHVTPLGNTLTFISYNAATGVISYSYTLLDNEAHPGANGQNSIFEDFEVILTDADNDVDTDTLSVQIVDDVPTAVNDTANQVGENNPVVINAFANDTFGADGVDIDNSPTVAVTFTQPPAGQGSVSYNPATGLFTFTPLAGQQGSTSFTYTITDGDGDPSTATVTINLAADSVPIVTAAVAAVDDDGLTGGNPASVTGDLDANAGEVPLSASEATYNGTFVANFGGDTPGTFSLAAMHGTSGSVGTETVNYTYAGNVLTATGPRGPLFTVTVNPATGAYTVQLLDNVLHVAGLNENDATAALTFTATDSDGDSTPGTLTITFDDDAPTAVNDTVNQVTENSSVTFGVFGNDAFGADGVDTDNNPVVAVTFTQPPVGQGTVSYNAGTGKFTFVPAAGQQGSTSFTYTITDGDGDPSTATVTINLQPDSVPIVTAAVAAVDDDGLTGGNAASVTGDLNANAGEVPLSASEATYNGTFVANFGGDTGTFSLAAMHGTSGSVGTETVNYTYAGNVLTATGPRGPLFTVTVNPATGAYTVQLLDNVLHVAGLNENDATAALTFTATDSDGDSTNGTLTITFDDDAPTLGTIQDGTANNLPGSAPSVGTLHLVIGADSPAIVDSISVDLTGVTSGGKGLVTSFSGGVLTAWADVDASGTVNAGDTQVFTLTVNPGTDQYTFDLLAPLDATVTDVPIGGTTSFGAGPAPYQVVSATDVAVDPLAVITGWSTNASFNAATWYAGAAAPAGVVYQSVNGSTAGWGVNNNNFTAGEFIRWDFGEPIDDFDGPGGYAPPNPAVNLPEISVATFEHIGYVAGDTIQYVVHYTDGTTDSYTFAGSVQFPVITADAGKFIDWIDTYTPNAGSGKIDIVSVGVQSTTLDIDLNFDVAISDADGDQVTGSFTINVDQANSPSTPEAAFSPLGADEGASDFSSLGLMASNDDQQQQQTQKIAANTNTVVLAAAVAAAGMTAEAAAASDPHVGDESALSAESQSVASSDDTGGSGAEESARSELGGETSEAVVEKSSEASSRASSSDDQAAGGGSLTADNDVSPASQPVDLLEATEAPASVTVESIVAPMVSVPSAEALIAAQLEGGESEGSQANAVVGMVLVDALEGGGAEASVDALLEALPAQGLGENAAVEALASQPSADVSAWDSGNLGGYAAGQNFTMEAVALHHDAVQPVANG